MECERCKQRPATIHFTEIINGNKRTLRLCEVCAREVQAESFSFIPQMNLHNLLASMFHPHLAAQSQQPAVNQGLKCERCGLSEAQFARQGLLGCSECYRVFAGRLEDVFRRLHGNTGHIGKVPERTGGKVRLLKEIERLKKQLKEAVEREEFERAAALRDLIRDKERELA
ncbi:MAG: UvrB/UvrC motif-containing protein [Bacillota bacterium]|uniref:UvrB/UvrC motif-containing protein n=1 Tax=Desulfurispora thermophila TaxID=265470 RepID=UPI0003662A45|nr:UvrB/UvrC motif-containing protein [Desulfurispora thermophila]